MTKTKVPTRVRPPTRPFVLGRAAFAKISEVEGIVPSWRLSADLRRLDKAPADKRRAALAAKYGKK